MNSQQKHSIFLFLTAFLFTGILHYSNLFCLDEISSISLRANVTVATSDDASYLAPVENWLKGDEWRSNATGNAAITTRSPGYGMVYAVFRSVLSEQNALRCLLIFQLGLFAFAVTLVPKIAEMLGIRYKLAIMIALVVAILPTFSGFLSYTITEAITPSLVIVFLFLLLRFHRFASPPYYLAALVLGFLIIVRPPMLIWAFSVVVLLFSSPFRQMGKRLAIVLIVGLAPLLLWQVFISVKTGAVQSIHPIYQSDSNDLYRPLHAHIWDYHKSLGQEGPVFNATVNALWDDALNDRNPDKTIKRIIQSSNKNAVDLIGYESLEQAYADYFAILTSQVPFNKAGAVIAGESPEEKDLEKRFDLFHSRYTQKYPFNAYLIVPLKVYFQMGFHSNLSLYVFQKTWRGNFLVEALRYFSFFIHFGLFLLFPIAAFATRKSLYCRVISIPVLLYLGYLCFVQRGVEERYTLPVLVPMLLIVVVWVDGLVKQLIVKLR